MVLPDRPTTGRILIVDVLIIKNVIILYETILIILKAEYKQYII